MEIVKNTLAENFGGPADKLAPAEHQFSIDDVPRLDGKVAVVTGGSEGIGYACTHTLLARGVAKLFILSLSEEVVKGATQRIQEEMGDDAANRTEWIQCDLTDWKRVKDVAEEIKGKADRLDILINNAARGIMTAQLSDYGVDRHLALNHMGHVILTTHLLPLMKETASRGNTVRIANLASNAHQGAPSDFKFSSLEEINKDHGPNAQYGISKLANILYSRYLARHLTTAHPKILANASHPGVVSTKQSTEHIHEAYPYGGYGVSVLLDPFKKDIFQGSISTLYNATKTETSGEYICPPAVPEPGTSLAQDEQLGEQLMKLTREVIMDKTKKDSVDQGCPVDDLQMY